MTHSSLTRAQPADIDALMALERRCFELPWGRLSFESELAGALGQGLVVRAAPSPVPALIIGYIFFRCMADEVHIFRIAVAPEWRRQGIGSRLVTGCLRAARRRGARRALLEVRASNTEALALYRRHGFRDLAVRPGYYTDTREDAVILLCELEEIEALEESDRLNEPAEFEEEDL